MHKRMKTNELQQRLWAAPYHPVTGRALYDAVAVRMTAPDRVGIPAPKRGSDRQRGARGGYPLLLHLHIIKEIREACAHLLKLRDFK